MQAVVSCHLSVGLWCTFKDLLQVLEEVYEIPVGAKAPRDRLVPFEGGLGWTLSTLVVLVVPTVCSASLGKIILVSIPVTHRSYCKSQLDSVLGEQTRELFCLNAA